MLMNHLCRVDSQVGDSSVHQLITQNYKLYVGRYTVLNHLLSVFPIFKALCGLFRYSSQNFATAFILMIQTTDEDH